MCVCVCVFLCVRLCFCVCRFERVAVYPPVRTCMRMCMSVCLRESILGARSTPSSAQTHSLPHGRLPGAPPHTVRHRGMGTELMGTILRFAQFLPEK